jgi:hypothetical protein
MGSPCKIFKLVSEEDRNEIDRMLKARKPYREVQKRLIDLGCRVGLGTIQNYAKLTGTRDVRRRRFLRIDRLIPEELRADYEALISDPRTRTEDVIAWLVARQLSASRSAIERHRNRFLTKMDRLRRDARHAEMVVKVAKESGITGLAEAALVKLEQFLLEFYTQTRRDGGIEPEQLTQLTKAMVDVMGTRKIADALRREFEADKRPKSAGVQGTEVVERMREILGIEPDVVNDDDDHAA